MARRHFTIHRSLFTIVSGLLITTSAAHAEVVGTSNFPVDPTAGNSRYTYNPADHTVTAHVNTSLPTSKLLFPLTRSLSSNESFTFTTRFKINSANFTQDPFGFAQIAFGLVNATTTGNDRSGGIGHDFNVGNFGSSGNTYDLVTFDYFPNLSTFFPTPNLQSVIITSKTGTEPAFANLIAPNSIDTGLNGPGEAGLPFDTFLNALVSYNANTRIATVQVATDAAPLLINAGGGLDGNVFTIETLPVPQGANFTVDSFVLPVWTDSYADFGPSVVADVVFSSFTVTAVPEPSSLALFSLAALPLLTRRRNAR